MKTNIRNEFGVSSSVSSEAPSQAPSLALLWLIWKERRLLLRAFAIGVAVSVTIAFLLPKEYDATARLMPPDKSASGLAMLSALSGKGEGLGLTGLSEMLGMQSTGETFVGVLRSGSVTGALVDRYDLRKTYRKRYLDDARKKLAQNSDISEDRKSGIITITVTDRDPHRAAALAQGYVDQLNDVVSRVSTSSARREREFLEGRLAQVKVDLEKAEVDLSHFSSANATLDVKEQGKAMLQGASQLQGELIAERSELEGLRQIYTDANPRVRTVRARIDELQQEIRKMGGQSGPAGAEVSQSQQQDDLYPSIRQLPVLGVTYADLYRNTVIQEAIFETLTKEFELAKVAEVKETPVVKVLDFAQVPEKKSFPPRTLIVFCGVLFALASAVGWILLCDAWQKMGDDSPKKIFFQEVMESFGGPFKGISRERAPFRKFKRAWTGGKSHPEPLSNRVASAPPLSLEEAPEQQSCDVEQIVGR